MRKFTVRPKSIMAASNTDTARIVQPTIDAIKQRYAQITGFECTLQKYYYSSQFDAVLCEFTQYYNLGATWLTSYNAPGRKSARYKGWIHLGNDSDIDRIVDDMVERLIARIQKTFDWKETLHNVERDKSFDFYYDDFARISQYTDSDIIMYIINQASAADERRACEFVQSLLDSGQVVNNLG